MSFQIGDPLTTSWPGHHMLPLSSATSVPAKLFVFMRRSCLTCIAHDAGGLIPRLFLPLTPLLLVASGDALPYWAKEIMGAAGVCFHSVPRFAGPASSGKAALQLLLYLFCPLWPGPELLQLRVTLHAGAFFGLCPPIFWVMYSLWCCLSWVSF